MSFTRHPSKVCSPAFSPQGVEVSVRLEIFLAGDLRERWPAKAGTTSDYKRSALDPLDFGL